MNSPLKERRKVKILRLIQWPFGWVFWLIERAILKLDTELERRRT
jgi:hypothetical protein